MAAETPVGYRCTWRSRPAQLTGGWRLARERWGSARLRPELSGVVPPVAGM